MFIVSYVVLFIGGMLLCYGGFLLADIESYMENYDTCALYAEEGVDKELRRAKGIAFLGGLLVIVGFVVCMALEAMV
jgi:hypothetical protein